MHENEEEREKILFSFTLSRSISKGEMEKMRVACHDFYDDDENKLGKLFLYARDETKIAAFVSLS